MMIPPDEVDASSSAGSMITLSPSGVRFSATECFLLSSDVSVRLFDCLMNDADTPNQDQIEPNL